MGLETGSTAAWLYSLRDWGVHAVGSPRLRFHFGHSVRGCQWSSERSPDAAEEDDDEATAERPLVTAPVERSQLRGRRAQHSFAAEGQRGDEQLSKTSIADETREEPTRRVLGE